jgi:hypothetical protein
MSKVVISKVFINIVVVSVRPNVAAPFLKCLWQNKLECLSFQFMRLWPKRVEQLTVSHTIVNILNLLTNARLGRKCFTRYKLILSEAKTKFCQRMSN